MTGAVESPRARLRSRKVILLTAVALVAFLIWLAWRRLSAEVETPRDVEIIQLATSVSPDGAHEAVLEMRVYVVGIGGDAPQVELRIGQPGQASESGKLVYASSEFGDNAMRWDSPTSLVIARTPLVEVHCLRDRIGPVSVRLEPAVDTQAAEAFKRCEDGD